MGIPEKIIFLFPSSFLFSVFLSFPSFLCVFCFLFFLFSVYSFLFPSLLLVLSLSSVSSLSPPFGFFFLPSLSSVSSVFIGEEKVLGPLLVRLGAGFAGGWSATTRDSKASFLYFRPVVGQCLRSVWGLWFVRWRCRGERGGKFISKNKAFPSVAGTGEGKKKGE